MQERVKTMRNIIKGMQKEQVEKILYIALTVVLVFMLSFFIKETVNGKSGANNLSDRIKIADVAEEEYLQELEEILASTGLKNSGITMTKVIDVQGDFTYTVQLHNKRFETMNLLEKNDFLSKLEAFSFSRKEATFIYLIG